MFQDIINYYSNSSFFPSKLRSLKPTFKGKAAFGKIFFPETFDSPMKMKALLISTFYGNNTVQTVLIKPILNILKLNEKDATSKDLKGWRCTGNVTA